MVIVTFASCKKEDTACYIFTVTNSMNVLPPPDSTYPKIIINEDEVCDLDENEAKETNSGYYLYRIDTLNNGVILIVDVSSTFRKK
jgi:hypothetical protein